MSSKARQPTPVGMTRRSFAVYDPLWPALTPPQRRASSLTVFKTRQQGIALTPPRERASIPTFLSSAWDPFAQDTAVNIVLFGVTPQGLFLGEYLSTPSRSRQSGIALTPPRERASIPTFRFHLVTVACFHLWHIHCSHHIAFNIPYNQNLSNSHIHSHHIAIIINSII